LAIAILSFRGVFPPITTGLLPRTAVTTPGTRTSTMAIRTTTTRIIPTGCVVSGFCKRKTKTASGFFSGDSEAAKK
jgi:hypothetical protein